MKNIFIMLLPLAMYGCASFQEPVDDQYLSEMTKSEQDTIAALKTSIIDNKTEKDRSAKQVEISEEWIHVSNARLAFLSAQKDWQLRRDKLFLLSADTAKQQATHQMITQTDNLIRQETVNGKYCVAKRDADSSALRVKEAELSVLVSQLDFEKAKIAREYQIRRYGDKYSKLIDPNKFGDYYTRMQNNLTDCRKDYQAAQDTLKRALDELKATGYEDQK